jgi:hypothetical protein
MREEVSYINVLDAFDKMDVIMWPQLSQLFSYLDASAIEKKDLAEIIKTLVNLQLIERLPGLPMKWKITNAGKERIKALSTLSTHYRS